MRTIKSFYVLLFTIFFLTSPYIIFAKPKAAKLRPLGCIYETTDEEGLELSEFVSSPFTEEDPKISKKVFQNIRAVFEKFTQVQNLDADLYFYDDAIEVNDYKAVKAMAFRQSKRSSADGAVVIGKNSIKYLFYGPLATGEEKEIKYSIVPFEAILAHELGHIAMSKSQSISSAAKTYKSPVLEEIAADYFSGQTLTLADIVPSYTSEDLLKNRDNYKTYIQMIVRITGVFKQLGAESSSEESSYGNSKERADAFSAGTRYVNCPLELVSTSPIAVSPKCKSTSSSASVFIRIPIIERTGDYTPAVANDYSLQSKLKRYIDSFSSRFSSVKGSYTGYAKDFADYYSIIPSIEDATKCQITDFKDKDWEELDLGCRFDSPVQSTATAKYQHIASQLKVVVPSGWEQRGSFVAGSLTYEKEAGSKRYEITLSQRNMKDGQTRVSLSFTIYKNKN